MFAMKNGVLFAEDVPVSQIAQKTGTPFYVYSAKILKDNFTGFSTALSKLDSTICYSIKANNNLGVAGTIASLGGGADVVSAGEMYVALKAGIPANKIVFSGVGKTKEELESAINNKILQINAESEAEVNLINTIALRLGIKANVAMRVNPDVDARTHVKITTGKKENKFGVDWDEAKKIYLKMRGMEGINISGLAMHIGSQLLDLNPFRLAFAKMALMVDELESEGINLRNLDVGGGLGINYNVELAPSKTDYAKVIEETLGRFNKHIILEPGRAIVGEAGVLITEVLFAKQCGDKRFIIVDAGMNDLVRPAMYEAWHTITPVIKKDAELITADIVGPICETSDTFAKDRIIESVSTGDLLAMFGAGAYGSSMSSIYNFRPLVPEVLVNGDTFEIVRERPSYEQMLSGQHMPPWLK